MNNYPQQVQTAYRALQTQAETVRNGWTDTVSQRFFNDYMNRFEDDTNWYVQELTDTLSALENCQREMSALM
jgi:hypothetical protein